MTTGRFVACLRVHKQRQGVSRFGLAAQRTVIANYLIGRSWQLAGEYVEIESGKRDAPRAAKALTTCSVHGAAMPRPPWSPPRSAALRLGNPASLKPWVWHGPQRRRAARAGEAACSHPPADDHGHPGEQGHVPAGRCGRVGPGDRSSYCPRTGSEHPAAFHRLIPSAVDNSARELTRAGATRHSCPSVAV
jgi:hypothetical protein